MPTFSFKTVPYTARLNFLKALADVHRNITYPQSLTVYGDIESFAKRNFPVPEGAWWVQWQSFNVEGEGTSKIRPLPSGIKGQGQYLGEFQNGEFHTSAETVGTSKI